MKHVSTRRSVLALLICLAPPVMARQPEAPVREVVERFLGEQTAGLAGEVRIETGRIDDRNQLPPCRQLQAFLPAGARAWGAVTVGVRCIAPANWTLYVPSRVRVQADYLTTARALSARQTLGPEDLDRAHGDIAALPGDILSDPVQAIGHPMRYAVAAGQPLRAGMLLLPPVVRQRDQVRVVTNGAGFSVSNEGKALNSAAAGQVVKVRLASGRVISGIARPDGVVEVGR